MEKEKFDQALQDAVLKHDEKHVPSFDRDRIWNKSTAGGRNKTKLCSVLSAAVILLVSLVFLFPGNEKLPAQGAKAQDTQNGRKDHSAGQHQEIEVNGTEKLADRKPVGPTATTQIEPVQLVVSEPVKSGIATSRNRIDGASEGAARALRSEQATAQIRHSESASVPVSRSGIVALNPVKRAESATQAQQPELLQKEVVVSEPVYVALNGVTFKRGRQQETNPEQSVKISLFKGKSPVFNYRKALPGDSLYYVDAKPFKFKIKF